MIIPKERTVLFFIEQLLNALTFADTKLWRSIKMIVLCPGEYSSQISKGKRVGFMRPVNLFFLCNLIYFLFPVLDTFNTSLRTQISGLPSSELFNVEERVMEQLDNQGLLYEEYQPLYDEKSSSTSKLMLIILVFLFSIGLRSLG